MLGQGALLGDGLVSPISLLLLLTIGLKEGGDSSRAAAASILLAKNKAQLRDACEQRLECRQR